MAREPYEKVEQILTEQRKKKPFCNAFTGCGRKRADESIAMLFEMNPEAAAAVSSLSSDMQELNKDGSAFDQDDDDDEAEAAANLWRALRQARILIEAASTKRPKEPRIFERSLSLDGTRRSNGRIEVGGTNYEKARWPIADAATSPLLRLPSRYAAPKKMRTSESDYVMVAPPGPLSLRRHSKDTETRKSWYDKGGDVKSLRLKFE